jgi:hypothetical protein
VLRYGASSLSSSSKSAVAWEYVDGDSKYGDTLDHWNSTYRVDLFDSGQACVAKFSAE